MNSDPPKIEDDEFDQLWLDEAERRLERYDSGETSARDIGSALSEIEKRLLT